LQCAACAGSFGIGAAKLCRRVVSRRVDAARNAPIRHGAERANRMRRGTRPSNQEVTQMVNDPVTEVLDNQSHCRYEIWVDGELAGVEGYEIDEHGVVTLLHTVIDDEYIRQGYARAMVRGILDGMRVRQQRFRPVCTYVQRFLTRFPEYQDLVAE
jgi:predicted GNAT family acetyltransferase